MTQLFARSSISTVLSLALSLSIGCSVEAPSEDAQAVQQASTVSGSVISSSKCPERIEGQGPGNYVGGMCIYPEPPGGCSELGADCTSVNGENNCRCRAKELVGGGGLPNIPEKLSGF